MKKQTTKTCRFACGHFPVIQGNICETCRAQMKRFIAAERAACIKIAQKQIAAVGVPVAASSSFHEGWYDACVEIKRAIEAQNK